MPVASYNTVIAFDILLSFYPIIDQEIGHQNQILMLLQKPFQEYMD